MPGIGSELYDAATDAAAGVVGVNEKRADHRGLGGGIAERVGAGLAAVTAVEGFALAPAAAADDAGGTGRGGGIDADEEGGVAEAGADGG